MVEISVGFEQGVVLRLCGHGSDGIRVTTGSGGKRNLHISSQKGEHHPVCKDRVKGCKPWAPSRPPQQRWEQAGAQG